ncbi:MAG: hypothetical protein OK457_04185 [Thaumarchaeota archaeon]|nr:hypothetical protein [Nitrososphaerota archaeon]
MNETDFLRSCFNRAKHSVEAHIFGKKAVGYRFFLFSTISGRREYYRYFEEAPIMEAGQYGWCETKDSKIFIGVQDKLPEGDLIGTLIHEILHGLYPNESEENIRKMESYCCDRDNIERENLLEELNR